MERLQSAINLVREARTIAENAHLGLPWMGIHHLSHHPTDLSGDDAFHTARKQVDFGGWDYLMSESGLISFMDAKAREAWRKQLESDELPELSVENIIATFRHVHSTRGEMFERGVISLFKRLS